MKKKGFTLIELLAVIIILAIIALIATPIVLNVIEDAKKSAGQSEANMVLKGITDYCEQENMGIAKTTYCKDETTLKENLDKIVNLGKLDKNDVDVVIKDGKLEWLNVNSNGNNYGLQDGGMVLDAKRPPKPNLIETLLKQYKPENTVGLLKDGETTRYYYKGTNEQVSNNFLWYGGHQWRVLEFDTNAKTLKLITQQPLTAISYAVSVWTDDTSYKSTYINKWLNEENPNNEYDGVFYNSLREDVKKNIVNTTFNIGTSPNISELTVTKKVGLLDETQYTNAGGQNSYLDIKDNWWLQNRYSSSSVRYVGSDGSLGNSSYPSDPSGVRPVITISDITIHEGDGTLKQNYKLFGKANNTSLVQVGDYIKVPYSGAECNSNFCMFRVVSKDDDSIKVVLNGLLKTEIGWANDTSDHLLDTDLVYNQVLYPFVEKIYSNYLMKNKTFGVGDYPSGDYNIAQTPSITPNKEKSSVGLPVIGEMFSGNDIDMHDPFDNTETFLDTDLIENPTASMSYWTMNRYNSSYVRFVRCDGVLSYSNNPTNTKGVRPVIFLNNNLEFKLGDGSPSSPYELKIIEPKQ